MFAIILFFLSISKIEGAHLKICGGREEKINSDVCEGGTWKKR